MFFVPFTASKIAKNIYITSFMKTATSSDKQAVIAILTASFKNNKSVNYIVLQDKKKSLRVERLMAYAFEMCMLFGKVYLSDDQNACALLLHPESKKTTIKTLWLDLKVAFGVIGILNIKKALLRERQSKARDQHTTMAYLWFLGADPKVQGTGVGKKLMIEMMEKEAADGRRIYLETSTLVNIPWYEKLGFEVYKRLNVGYELFFLRRS